MDIVLVVLVIGLLAVMIFKKFRSVVYYIGIVDIFLRILNFIASNIPFREIKNFIVTYFPSSVPDIITAHSDGIFTTVMLWALCIIYIILDYYLFKTFLKKK